MVRNIWPTVSGSLGIAVTFLLDSNNLFIFLSNGIINFVSVFTVKLHLPKSEIRVKGIR